MKIIFFGSDGLALPTLRLLVQQSWCDSIVVVTQPDRPAGRKQLLTPTAVKQLAQELGLTVIDQLTTLPSADLGVVVYYGKKIPPRIIEQLPHGIINIHPSLLPRWRGPSPIKSAMLQGDTVTGVSIMLIDAGLDTGPILAQRTTTITPTELASTLEQRLGILGAELLIETIPPYYAGKLQPVNQSSQGVTLSPFFTKADGELNPQATDQQLWNHYRALQPWPGVFFMHQGERYKITSAHWDNNLFCVDTIQPAGKKPIPLPDFKRGYPAVSFAHII